MTNKIKYNNPPVSEIICQFRFFLPEETPWTSKKPGELLKILDDYPNLEMPKDVGVNMHFKEGSVTPELLAPKQRFIYSDNEKNKSINITEDSFAFIYKVTEKHKYESWRESFEPAFKETWNKVRKCLGIKNVQSIGVRYINHINESYGLPLHQTLNKESKYLPEIIIDEHLAFFNRSEILQDEKNRLIVQVGIAHKESEYKDKILILDIDRIIEDNINSSSGDLIEKVESLQKHIEEIFFSSISNKMKEKMSDK